MARKCPVSCVWESPLVSRFRNSQVSISYTGRISESKDTSHYSTQYRSVSTFAKSLISMVANVETPILGGPKTQVRDHTKTGLKGQRNQPRIQGIFARYSAHFS